MKIFNVYKFIKDLKAKCKLYNVKLVLHNSKYIEEDGKKYGGWFDADKKELHCCFPENIQSKYVELLVHESCHLDQWVNNTKAWQKHIEENSLQIFFDYLDGNKVKHLTKHVNIIQRMEAECERLSVQKIKDYDLGIDTKTYTQKANSYILMYTVMKETQRWCDKPPYRFKDIWTKMPIDEILSDYSMDNSLKFLYKRKCYKKETPLKK